MLNFRSLFNLNLFLGVACCFAYENFAFGDMKMLNFWPYFSLNVYDLGVARPLKENYRIDELKIPNFRPFFSLKGAAPFLLLRKFFIW